jgi:hypothetical protein
MKSKGDKMTSVEKPKQTTHKRHEACRARGLLIGLAIAAMAATPALAKPPQCPPLCSRPPIAWSGSFQYDDGVLPRVASIGNNEVIEVHQGAAGGTVPLWYDLGSAINLNSPTQAKIKFLGSVYYVFGAAPSVAGIVESEIDHFDLVEAHQADVDSSVPLWSDRGSTYQNGPVDWLSQGQYDSGYAPAVAMDRDGWVEVHQASWGLADLWYHLNGGPSIQYDYGSAPSVSISSGEVVEVHEGVSGSLLYRAGPVNGSEIAFGPGLVYDSGYFPSVSIVGNTAVEVHQGTSSCPGPLWYRVGTIGGQKITWSNSVQYDYGCSPSVATDGHQVYEVHQAGPGVGPMWSRLGFLQ